LRTANSKRSPRSSAATGTAVIIPKKSPAHCAPSTSASATSPLPTRTTDSPRISELFAKAADSKQRIKEIEQDSLHNSRTYKNEFERKVRVKVDSKYRIEEFNEPQSLLRSTAQLQQQSAILKKNAELENGVLQLRAEAREHVARIKNLAQKNKKLKNRFAKNASTVSECSQQKTR